MALILNKSIPGITSTDEFGNSLTGYTNLDYTDLYGNVHENPYLVIDAVIFNKLVKFCKIYVSIYKDKNSRENKKKSINENEYVINNDSVYDNYFSISNMENVNVFTASYNYINNVYGNWKSDQ